MENGLSNYSLVKKNATYNPAVAAVFMGIGTLTLTANTLIVTVYCSSKFVLLKKPSNRLLFSLAVCDLATALGIFCVTLNIIFPDIFGLPYRVLVDIYEAFLVKTLVFHLCGLTLDRYIALFFALRYQAIVTNIRVKRYLVVSWLVPLLASGVQLTWLHKIILGNATADDDTEIYKMDFWYSILSFLVFLATPMVLLLAAFGSMITEIQRITLNTPGRTVDRQDSLSLREKRCTYIYSVMFVTFLLLAMPYYSLRLKNDLEVYFTENHQADYSEVLARVVVASKYSTSVIRPVLYILTSVKWRAVASQLSEGLIKSHRGINYLASVIQGSPDGGLDDCS